MAVLTTRRYYMLKRLDARARCLEEDAWIEKQSNEPGTAFAPEFPSLATLNAAGYLAVEDVNGAEDNELESLGLNPDEIEDIQAALAAL